MAHWDAAWKAESAPEQSDPKRRFLSESSLKVSMRCSSIDKIEASNQNLLAPKTTSNYTNRYILLIAPCCKGGNGWKWIEWDWKGLELSGRIDVDWAGLNGNGWEGPEWMDGV